MSYYILICNSPCETAVSQFNVTTDFAVKVVHTSLNSGHVEYDKSNDIMSTK